jgi:sialate O-acetylesterase
MNYNRVLLFFVIFTSIFVHSFAQIKLPSLIGDHMVLQRNSTVPIWGWSTPGSEITIQTDWDNSNYSCKTAENGRWIVNIETPDA